MHILITGSSRGIGLAIAEKFAAAGYSVYMHGKDEKRLAAAAEEISKKYPAVKIASMAANLSTKSGADELGTWLLSQSVPDVLVNNAGSYLPGDVLSESADTCMSMIETNLMSAYWLTRKIVPAMKSRGSGHVFNVSSIAGLQAYSGGGSYSISKFALHGFSKNLREELKPHGVKVSTVFPGAVMTDSWGDFDNSKGRIMEAKDIADMIFAAALLSPQAVAEDIILRPQQGDL